MIERIIRIVFASVGLAIKKKYFNEATNLENKYDEKEIATFVIQGIDYVIGSIFTLIWKCAINSKKHLESQQSDFESSNWQENKPYLYSLNDKDVGSNSSDLLNSQLNIVNPLDEGEVRDRSSNRETSPQTQRQTQAQKVKILNSEVIYESVLIDHPTLPSSMI